MVTPNGIYCTTWDTRWTNEIWFAPEVKQFVKFAPGGRGGESWELVSYELKRE
jgi:hypothetical protein